MKYLYLTLLIIAVGVVGTIWIVKEWAAEKGASEESEMENATGADEKPRLEADAYPLYDGVEWGEAEILEGGLVRVASMPIIDTTNIAAVARPFTGYYHDKLISAGWKQDLMREAGGPGASVSYYAKDGRFIVVSFESEFKIKHDDAPSECPCDVTLSLTSGRE